MLDEKLADISRSISSALKDIYGADADTTLKRGTRPGIEFFTPISFELGKSLGLEPRDVAQKIASRLKMDGTFSATADGAFLNISLSGALYADYFSHYHFKTFPANGKKINIEFISANPTGPLNVVSGRAAAVGLALSSLYRKFGWEVSREYYVNDHGNQMNIFASSLLKAYAERFKGETAEYAENEYTGPFTGEIAEEIGDIIEKAPGGDRIKKEAVKAVIGRIKGTLKNISLDFDRWFFESSLYETGENEGYVLDTLRKKGLLYEKDGALFIKNTALGDSQDWVLKKSSGEYTYLFGDIMYHIDKFRRGYDKAINIWGPDHLSGAVRLIRALTAFGIPEEFLSVIILQQVNLIKDGRKIQMSKRTGNFIGLDEILDSVGADPTKYFFLSKGTSQHIDFDFDAFEKESEKSPVFYLQYMFARINGVLLKKYGVDLDGFLDSEKADELELGEISPMQKEIIYTVYVLEAVCAEALTKNEPAMVMNHMNEIAKKFHRFYQGERILGSEREEELLGFIVKLGGAVRSVLTFMGINAPQRM